MDRRTVRVDLDESVDFNGHLTRVRDAEPILRRSVCISHGRTDGTGVGGSTGRSSAGAASTLCPTVPRSGVAVCTLGAIQAICAAPLFTFLSDMPEPASVVLGDARLSLRDVPGGTHDLLVMDVFSSDSPPAHLLTVEALGEAMRTVAPDGLLAVHVSNRYFDLAPAVAGAGEDLGLVSLQRTYSPSALESERLLATRSSWVVLVRKPSDIAELASRGWTHVDPVPPLTDDNADTLRLLRLWR